MISRIAVEALPDEVPAFLRAPDAVDKIGELAREPDRSKGTGTPHDEDLNPGHYVNLLDDQAVYGVALSPLPIDREAYDTALREHGSDEYKAGYLPYSIIDGWQQLQKDFAYWRVDSAGEQSSKDHDDRGWYASDRQLREMIIIRDVGYWSHFVGDASQPMHTSIHYDGWGNYPNPQGYSMQKGFHAFFEGAFVRSNITENDIRAWVRPYRECGCTIEDRTVTYLLATQGQLVQLYELQKRGAFVDGNAEGNQFVANRLAAAVLELRDMIVDAWRTSMDATVRYPPVKVRDVLSGEVDPIEQLKALD